MIAKPSVSSTIKMFHSEEKNFFMRRAERPLGCEGFKGNTNMIAIKMPNKQKNKLQ